MPADDSITQWVRKARAGGDEHAARQLWERFFSRLIAIARQRMRGRNSQMADEEDVVLSAFNSFYVGLRQGRFPDLDGRDGLWRLLLVITARKVADQFAFDHRGKRDAARLARRTQGDDHQDEILRTLVSREPTPEMAAEFSDQLGALLRALVRDDLQQVALLKMEGYTNGEIAKQQGRSLTTIERKLRTIRSIWSQMR